MKITTFDLVDLGVFPAESDALDMGPGFRDRPDVFVGTGGSAAAAFQSVLDELTAQGLDVENVQASGRLLHFESEEARVPAGKLAEGDEIFDGQEVQYFVGIRYVDPRVVDVDDDDDGQEGGGR